MRRRYYRAFEWLMRQYRGRPHWAKNFLVGNGGEVEWGAEKGKGKGENEFLGGDGVWDDMYSRNLRRWRAIRGRVDPGGVFRSGWLERTVLAVEGAGRGGVEGTQMHDGQGEASTVFVDEDEGLEFTPIVEVE